MADGTGVENGQMDGKAVWSRRERRGGVVLDGRAHLSDYDSGRDDLRQKIEAGKSTELFYSVRVGSDEQRLPSDLLLVRITNREGRQLAVLERYTHAGGGRWRRETLDLSCFADRIVYLIFFAETGPMLRTAFYLYRVTLKRGNVPKTAPPPRPPP